MCRSNCSRVISALPLAANSPIHRCLVTQFQFFPIDENHDRRGCRDRLGQRGQIENRVDRHRFGRRLNGSVGRSFPVDDIAFEKDGDDAAGQFLASDRGFDWGGDFFAHLQFMRAPHLKIWHWLVLLGATGIAMALIYPDSYQQDGGFHFLYAKSAWKHPGMFVEVWPRPLFTLIYSVPAQLGYLPAKLFTVAITLITAYQTFRLAQQLQLNVAWVAPLLLLEPSYLMLSADTMTEPLFALILVIALRLHVMKKELAGIIAASLLILARPEGFFIGVLWGIWILLDRSSPRTLWQRLALLATLASGAFLWWLAALLLTGDPLFIRNNWPREWTMLTAAGRSGGFWDYADRLPNIAGPLLAAVLILGLIAALIQRRLGFVSAVFLSFFLLHSAFRSLGLFGSACDARYFVCVAPTIALLTLNGWNLLASWFQRIPRIIQGTAAAAIFILSGLAAFLTPIPRHIPETLRQSPTWWRGIACRSSGLFPEWFIARHTWLFCSIRMSARE